MQKQYKEGKEKEFRAKLHLLGMLYVVNPWDNNLLMDITTHIKVERLPAIVS